MLKIQYELNQISKEYEVIEILAKKIQISNLDKIELRAASASIQSIYNGLEKILIMILKSNNYKIPNSHSWHSDLLLLCLENDFISQQLEADLRDLMGFRHFIRHAYSFMLDNDLLKPLLLKIDSLLKRFSEEISIEKT